MSMDAHADNKVICTNSWLSTVGVFYIRQLFYSKISIFFNDQRKIIWWHQFSPSHHTTQEAFERDYFKVSQDLHIQMPIRIYDSHHLQCMSNNSRKTRQDKMERVRVLRHNVNMYWLHSIMYRVQNLINFIVTIGCRLGGMQCDDIFLS